MLNHDMTATVAALTTDRLQTELAFAVPALDMNDPASCEWLACLLARHARDLPAATPVEHSPLAALCKEIKDALEGDSNDNEHAALVSAAEHLGLKWVSPEEREDQEADEDTAGAD
jgi:hypothetical protein